MKIGILSKNYAAQRLFLNKLDDAEYRDVRLLNCFLWRNAPLLVLQRLNMLNVSPEEIVSKLFYDYRAMAPTGCDILHFFNCINHSRRSRWVVSVESAVPWPVSVARIVESAEPDFSVLKADKYVRQRIENLANDNCLALLPLSECSYNIQMELLAQFSEHFETIKQKTYTLHPPQPLLVNSIEEKGLTYADSEQFTFMFVGRNYFRKGGRESVEVLAELHKRYDFKLILVSSLSVDERKYLRSDEDEQAARRLIEENNDWIEFHESLPNVEVLLRLKRAHVCLLPTWMDTYAYSVLESQACGTPLITTSLRAMTRTNNDEVGWTIEVPVNLLNNPLHTTPKQRDIFYEQLKGGLAEKVEYVLNHREEVKRKAANCLKRIAQHHSPDEYARRLRMAYEGRVAELTKQQSGDE